MKKLDHTTVSFLMSRRKFLQLSSLSTMAWLTGCATNPVTGKSQLMLVDENTEIQIDQQYAPQQFSNDFGITQDKTLNSYIRRTGMAIAIRTHRPHMPYSFQVVNAVYVNAYAFPGGSIAATRGILLKLDNEAELASLLGHELGHVNARHTAEHMSKAMVTQALVSGASQAAGSYNAAYGKLASQLGMVGAGALLAKYSRDNEREADSLGLAYMAKSGYKPDGFVGLMDMLNNMSHRHASSFEMLFATHPMSDERYRSAVQEVGSSYSGYQHNPLFRDRYMDHTAVLRAMEGAIVDLQRGVELMGRKKYPEAEAQFRAALKRAPDDYTGLLLMAQCYLVQKRYSEALTYTENARQVYPGEGQAQYLAGYTNIQLKKYGAAYDAFSRYEQLLPGNPSTTFFLGLSSEGMQRQKQAADYYYRYLQKVNQGDMAQYAYGRLKQWGYIR